MSYSDITMWLLKVVEDIKPRVCPQCGINTDDICFFIEFVGDDICDGM